MHEAVQPAKFDERLAPRPQPEMVGIRSTICAPISRKSAGVRPLTVAAVPTGMNAGVSTAPCVSPSVPRRAAPLTAWTAKAVISQGVERGDIIRRRRRLERQHLFGYRMFESEAPACSACPGNGERGSALP